MTECKKCPDYQWSSQRSATCENKTMEFLRWNDGFAILLTTFGSLGILAVLAIAILFTKHFNTPAVKSAGGFFCYAIFISLVLSFCSTGFFIGEPTELKCQIRQPLYGISFTCCVSCILVKTLKIILAFKFTPNLKKNLKFKYWSVLIVIVLSLLQALLCTLWLTLKSPFLQHHMLPKEILSQCNEGSHVAFGIMLGYIAMLALVCFILAYKGRKLPNRYNEARLITFSMLVCLFVWILFIPVHVKTAGKYLSTVEVVAILASNYGVIFCLLLPKCYIILFKRESNNPIDNRDTILWLMKPGQHAKTPKEGATFEQR
ncbi:G-protein coupled receptor family C group 6 member A-like [Latimeria chalumnae]|uniref:G-protein coupled receptor family C group 6 member A-like n=1 Tax=Latimeria chalumnae TaxID=7897 RepID=UPI00313DCCAB